MKLLIRPQMYKICYKSYNFFRLMVCASALLMMLQRFGMICLMMYVQPLVSTHSGRSSNPISLHKHIHPNFSFSRFLSVAPPLAMSQAHDHSSLLFGLVRLESVFRWRLTQDVLKCSIVLYYIELWTDLYIYIYIYIYIFCNRFYC